MKQIFFLLFWVVLACVAFPDLNPLSDTPTETEKSSVPDSLIIFETKEIEILDFDKMQKHSIGIWKKISEFFSYEKKDTSLVQKMPEGKTYEGALQAGLSAWNGKEVAEKFIKLGKYDKRVYKYLLYVEKYKILAIDQYLEYGIPVSITLAQGLLESNAGESKLATEANNHFGIKCGSHWQGGKYPAKDDEYDKSGKKINSYFRIYKNTEEGFHAHSKFLLGDRYHWMREEFSAFDETYTAHPGWLGTNEVNAFQAWCIGLKMSGYATAPHYHKSLNGLITSLELYKMDVALYRYVHDK